MAELTRSAQVAEQMEQVGDGLGDLQEAVVEEEEVTVELELHLPQVAGHWTVIRS